MRLVARIEEAHPFLTGILAGLSAAVAYFSVAETWLDTPPGTLQVGAGLMLLVGVWLMLPQRTWLRGLGFLVGAAVSLVAVVVIAVIGAVQHTV